MRALVVGGAGFIGSHLCDRLLAEGSTVDVVDDLSTGTLANLATARASLSGEFRFHHLDVRSTEFGDLVVRRAPEVVYVLVQPMDSMRAAFDLAVGGVINVLDAAVRNRVAKVVVGLKASQLFGPVSQRELPLREAHPLMPVSAVGLAQRSALDVLAHYRQLHGQEFTALALSSVFGPRQRVGVVAEFLRARTAGTPLVVHGDGRQTRDLLFVDDAVDAFVRAASRGGGQMFNVGTGVQTAIRDLAGSMRRDDSPEVEHSAVRPTEIGRFALSSVRARIHLAWAPWTALNEGLELIDRV